jgi:hypothetical protein
MTPEMPTEGPREAGGLSRRDLLRTAEDIKVTRISASCSTR